MRTVFNYDGHEFVVDSAKHQIFVDGKEATGKFAPIGAVVAALNEEDSQSCLVQTDIDNMPVEKMIAYGAPLTVAYPVIILGDYVIPANLLVRNDLEDDYNVYRAKLEALLLEAQSAAKQSVIAAQSAAEQSTIAAQSAATAKTEAAQSAEKAETFAGNIASAVNSAAQSALSAQSSAQSAASAINEVNAAKQSVVDSAASAKSEADRAKQSADAAKNAADEIKNVIGDINSVLDTINGEEV